MAKMPLSATQKVEDKQPDKGKRKPNGDQHQNCLTAPGESANRLFYLFHALGKKI
jgi:hypothetical protein